MQKNIGSLEISMNNIFLMQSSEPINDVLEKVNRFGLSQSLRFIKVLLQRTILTVLHHNKYGLTGFKVIDETHNISIVSTSFHYFDL